MRCLALDQPFPHYSSRFLGEHSFCSALCLEQAECIHSRIHFDTFYDLRPRH